MVSRLPVGDRNDRSAWEPRWLDPITGGAGVLRTFLCPCPRRSSRPTILSLLVHLPLLFLSVRRGSSPFLETVRSAYAVYESACFLAGVYTHFPSVASPHDRLPLAPIPSPFPLVHRHLSPPPAPREIKPHLSSLIIVVTYSASLVRECSRNEPWPSGRKNSAREKRRAKTEEKDGTSRRERKSPSRNVRRFRFDKLNFETVRVRGWNCFYFYSWLLFWFFKSVLV